MKKDIPRHFVLPEEFVLFITSGQTKNKLVMKAAKMITQSIISPPLFTLRRLYQTLCDLLWTFLRRLSGGGGLPSFVLLSSSGSM